MLIWYCFFFLYDMYLEWHTQTLVLFWIYIAIITRLGLVWKLSESLLIGLRHLIFPTQVPIWECTPFSDIFMVRLGTHTHIYTLGLVRKVFKISHPWVMVYGWLSTIQWEREGLKAVRSWDRDEWRWVGISDISVCTCFTAKIFLHISHIFASSWRFLKVYRKFIASEGCFRAQITEIRSPHPHISRSKGGSETT